MEINQIKSKFFCGSFDQNTYVILDKNSAVLIDAGAGIEDINSIIGNRKVLAVLITHIHFDHIFNIEKIIKEYNCDVYIQKGCSDRFGDAYKNVSYPFGLNLKFDVPKEKIKIFSDFEKIGNFKFEIIKTAGHSQDGVCIKIGDNLFTGDTVFNGAIGRTDFYDGDNKKMEESLKKIRDIDFLTAFPGHYGKCGKDDILKTISYYID